MAEVCGILPYSVRYGMFDKYLMGTTYMSDFKQGSLWGHPMDRVLFHYVTAH